MKEIFKLSRNLIELFQTKNSKLEYPKAFPDYNQKARVHDQELYLLDIANKQIEELESNLKQKDEIRKRREMAERERDELDRMELQLRQEEERLSQRKMDDQLRIAAEESQRTEIDYSLNRLNQTPIR